MSGRRGGAVRALVRRHPGLTLVAVPCAAVVVAAALLWSPQPGTAGSPPARVGADLIAQNRPAPDFDLPLLSGTGTLRLSSLRGHVVVVNFWASWCTACRQEVPAMASLFEHFRGTGVQFVGIDQRDARSSAVAFARRSGMSYPSVVDHNGKVLGNFGAVGLPTTYVVDSRGRIRYEAIGTVDVGGLRRSLDLVRTGHPAPAAVASAPPIHLTDMGGRAATDFTLVDQFGRRTSLSGLRGRPLLLTFVDSRCEDVCSLTAEVLQRVQRLLGDDGRPVRLLAVNANPRHFTVADVRKWSLTHGMLHRWRYVTGQPSQLRVIWRDYAVSSHYESGELEHEAVVYVLDGGLRERSLLSMSSLRTSVDAEAAVLARAVRDLPTTDCCQGQQRR